MMMKMMMGSEQFGRESEQKVSDDTMGAVFW
jgi:hypothetical protein